MKPEVIGSGWPQRIQKQRCRRERTTWVKAKGEMEARVPILQVVQRVLDGVELKKHGRHCRKKKKKGKRAHGVSFSVRLAISGTNERVHRPKGGWRRNSPAGTGFVLISQHLRVRGR